MFIYLIGASNIIFWLSAYYSIWQLCCEPLLKILNIDQQDYKMAYLILAIFFILTWPITINIIVPYFILNYGKCNEK